MRTALTSASGPVAHPTFHPVTEKVLPAQLVLLPAESYVEYQLLAQKLRPDDFVLVMGYGEREFEKVGVHYNDKFMLYRGRGCANCQQTGYRGRAGIHELLIASDGIKKMVQTRSRVSEIAAAAQSEGMTTLLQDGILKALKGVTDYKQVKAVAIK